MWEEILFRGTYWSLKREKKERKRRALFYWRRRSFLWEHTLEDFLRRSTAETGKEQLQPRSFGHQLFISVRLQGLSIQLWVSAKESNAPKFRNCYRNIGSREDCSRSLSAVNALIKSVYCIANLKVRMGIRNVASRNSIIPGNVHWGKSEEHGICLRKCLWERTWSHHWENL